MRYPILIVSWLALVSAAGGGTRALTFVHQPLTTLGTDMDAGIVVASVPVLTNAVPEGLLSHVASPNRLLQDKSAGVSDSNILSNLGISLFVEHVKFAKYSVTMDLSAITGAPSDHGVTLEAVVVSTIECINKTIADTNVFHGGEEPVVWSLKLKAAPEDFLVLKKYQRDYAPHQIRRVEQGGTGRSGATADPQSEGEGNLRPESEERSGSGR